MMDNGGYVYFFQGVNGGNIKIGYSDNPWRRLDNIQYMSPDLLQLILVIQGDRKKEKELHERFKEFNVHHEWFSPNEELITFINECNKRGIDIGFNEELEVNDKIIMCTERTHRLLNILKIKRGDRAMNDTVRFLLLNVEDIKKIADKEAPGDNYTSEET